MGMVRRLKKLVRGFVNRVRIEREMDEEMRFHVDMETEEYIRAGLPPAAARREALVRFGGVERFKEEARMARGGRAMEDFVKDVRLAIRALGRSPGFTVVALTMLALGIGANTAIFSVLNAVLFQPFPFREPDRLVQVYETHMAQGWDHFPFSQMNLLDLMKNTSSFEGVGAITGGSKNLTGDGPPEVVEVNPVTPGFFSTLGVQPILGRLFRPDDVPGEQALPVLLVGEDAWVTRFGSDPDVVGRSILLDGESFQVVGVLPGGGPWLEGEFYRPTSLNPESNRTNHFLEVVARLRDGVSIEAAQTELTPLATRLTARNAPVDEGMGFRLEPSTRWAASAELRQSLWLFMGSVGVLLLIACINLANLLLARMAGRQRQVAVQVALGAERGRVMRQLLTESLVLGAAGAMLGVGVAVVGLRALVALEPGQVPRLESVAINGWVLLFTATIAVATGLAGGLLPAFRIPFDSLGTALRDGARGTGGGRGQARLRSLLVGAETALSLILLIGAGLLIRSLVAVNAADTGFDPEDRLTFGVNLPDTYTFADGQQFRHEFLDRLRSQSGVEAAAAVHIRPLSGGNTVMSLIPVGETVETFGGAVSADWRLISDDYFRTMGLSLLRGRDLSHEPPPPPSEDGVREPMEVVISQSLAQAVWPGQDPIGKQAQLWMTADRLGTVVGVVEDMREQGPGLDETLAIYLSYDWGAWSPVGFVVHAAGQPRALLPAIRSLLQETDPNLPLTHVQTLGELLRTSTASRRFTMTLLAVFAGVAMVLALAGLYGVIADSVSQRAPELGVRVALGASSGRVLSLILMQGMGPAVLGIGLGVLGALAASRVMRALLFGVAATDPLTYAVTGALLALAALAACWVPARAALRLDPVTVLREE